MRIGMLWFDDSSQRDLGAKIARAARHYETKYGIWPTMCYVHPSMLLGNLDSCAGMEVRANNMVLPNHFWLGVGEEKQAGKRTAV